MVVEILERRQLLSATANVVGGHVLTVQLDNSGETIIVQEASNGLADPSNDSVQVIESFSNGSNLFTFQGIKAIVVLGGSGNDSITAAIENVPVFIDGGSGSDTIAVVADVGNPATDTFGAGSVIMGGNDNDFIAVACLKNAKFNGGKREDSIIAGGVIDSAGSNSTNFGGIDILVDGGNGNDLLQSGFNSPLFGQLSALTDSTILGGNGSDTIVDAGNNNNVDGGNGTDTITVVNGDIVVSSNGHDLITQL